MCPYLCLSTHILPPIYNFGPDLALYIFQYLALFSFIYLYLSTFSLIWLYLALTALI